MVSFAISVLKFPSETSVQAPYRIKTDLGFPDAHRQSRHRLMVEELTARVNTLNQENRVLKVRTILREYRLKLCPRKLPEFLRAHSD